MIIAVSCTLLIRADVNGQNVDVVPAVKENYGLCVCVSFIRML